MCFLEENLQIDAKIQVLTFFRVPSNMKSGSMSFKVGMKQVHIYLCYFECFLYVIKPVHFDVFYVFFNAVTLPVIWLCTTIVQYDKLKLETMTQALQ